MTYNRRAWLTTLASLTATGSLAGCFGSQPEPESSTSGISGENAQKLAERFAPTLYFDDNEQWFPTDPRRYEHEEDGDTVVDGFDALNGYSKEFREQSEPPAPTMFYNAVEYEDSPLTVIQFWYYSAFDQFATNFHWHDWEVLHVFVDTDSGQPQLYVASSHSGRVPNNEYIDPDPERVPRVLSELESHSSALSLNDAADRFQRFPLDGGIADITNSAIEGIEDLVNFPLAYGLPRDEGSRLPYLVPELDGSPVYKHTRLPDVDRNDLIPDELTISSFSDLASPPGNLPARETGIVFEHKGRDTTPDLEYELVPATEVEHIADFTGPQLSFEFAVPVFAEDAIAGHITTTGVPWQQPRYQNPAADITDATHRLTLSERYDAIGAPGSINTVVAGISQALASDEAPDGEGLTTQDLTVESVVLLESNPEAVPTFGGLAVVQDVPEGDHQLTVNGAGLEPHSETVSTENDSEGPTTAGVAGEVPMVAREHSTKLAVDTTGSDDEITDLAVEDDFAGRMYDAPVEGRDAVYVHRGGAYTTEVRDAENEIGAYRVNPDDETRTRIDNPATGKASLSEYLADISAETASAVAAIGTQDDTDDPGGGSDQDGAQSNAITGLESALEAVAEAARRAADSAGAGQRGNADQSLDTVQKRLSTVRSRLAAAEGDIPAELSRAIGHRLDQSERRSEQARSTAKL